jgi:hypothetical protein
VRASELRAADWEQPPLQVAFLRSGLGQTGSLGHPFNFSQRQVGTTRATPRTGPFLPVHKAMRTVWTATDLIVKSIWLSIPFTIWVFLVQILKDLTKRSF